MRSIFGCTNFTDEALGLCVCDMNSKNFAIAMAEGGTFTRKVAKHLRYSDFEDVGAMQLAAGFLVICGRSDIGNLCSY